MSTADGSKRTKTDLSEDIFLYTTQLDDPVAFSYEVECATFRAVKVTINFDGSENFCCVQGEKILSELSLTATVRPFGREVVGRAKLVDRMSPARLKVQFEWEMLEPDDKEKDAFIEKQDEAINKVLEDAKSTANFLQLCKQGRKKFIDTDFSPTPSSLYATSNVLAGDDAYNLELDSAVGSETDATTASAVAKQKKDAITWKRASDFMQGDYNVFVGGIEPDDIRQGVLGDCWYLCSLACLGEFPELVEALILPESRSRNSTGIYYVRLCDTGMWRVVEMDDYFPCYPATHGGPVYARGHGNELWVMLLEKAYAKLCGSYAAIKSGWAFEAMIDLTGAPYDNYRFEDADCAKMIEDGSLWSLLKKYDDNGYLISASTPGEDKLTETGERRLREGSTGLVAGHAYALLSAKVTSQGQRLVQLRNPWGFGGMEWSGDWSDASPLWTEELKEELGVTLDADDGAFWMSFEDMTAYFVSVNICKVRHPVVNSHLRPWTESRRKFFFSLEDPQAPSLVILPSPPTAGGDVTTLPPLPPPVPAPDSTVSEKSTSGILSRNSLLVACPMYILTIPEHCDDVYISIHQTDTRRIGSKPYIDIGITVLKVSPNNGHCTLVASTGNTPERQNQTAKLSLEAGQYLIVPTSTGCKMQQFLAAATSKLLPGGQTKVVDDTSILTTDGEGSDVFVPYVSRAFEEIFERLDLDYDGALTKKEIDFFVMATEGCHIQQSTYDWLLDNFDSNAAGITLKGFVEAQVFAYKAQGGNKETLFEELRSLGYELHHTQTCALSGRHITSTANNANATCGSCATAGCSFQWFKGRRSTLVVHSACAHELTAHPYDANAFEDALELPIMAFGTEKCLDENDDDGTDSGTVLGKGRSRIKFYTRKAGYNGVSFVVKNDHPAGKTLHFQMDCRGSTNVISHRGSLNYIEEVPAGEAKVLHHLMPEKAAEWQWTYSASYYWGAYNADLEAQMNE